MTEIEDLKQEVLGSAKALGCVLTEAPNGILILTPVGYRWIDDPFYAHLFLKLPESEINLLALRDTIAGGIEPIVQEKPYPDDDEPF